MIRLQLGQQVASTGGALPLVLGGPEGHFFGQVERVRLELIMYFTASHSLFLAGE